MQRRIRRRYAAERRFRRSGCSRSACRSLFLAFLLWNMGSKGLGGFTQYEARLPIDFTRSDLFLDPAALARSRCGADDRRRGPVEGASRAPRRPLTARDAANLFGDAATTGADQGDRPESRHAQRHARRFGFRSAARSTSRPSTRATPATEKLVSALETEACAAPDASTPTSSTSVRRDRPVVGRHLGGAQGHVLHDRGDDAARLPDRRPGGGLSRGIRAAEPLDRRDRGIDQQSRGGPLDHLRPAGPGGVPQRHEPAALGAPGRRHDAGPDDHAGDRHRRPQRDQVRAAVDPRGGARASARRRCR